MTFIAMWSGGRFRTKSRIDVSVKDLDPFRGVSSCQLAYRTIKVSCSKSDTIHPKGGEFVAES